MLDIFHNKKCNQDKLQKFGFICSDGKLIYSSGIVAGQFKMIVTVDSRGGVAMQVIDNDTGAEYILHQVEGATGSFVGRVRAECRELLRQIADNCFEADVFKGRQSCQVIRYVEQKYQGRLEYLWPKFPNNAIWRRQDNRKWYGVLLTVAKEKLNIPGKEIIEIMDVRAETQTIERVVDYKRYFPGYHMNKKHWLTVCLDGSVPLSEIQERIDESYDLAASHSNKK